MYRVSRKEPLLCYYASKCVRRNLIESRVLIKYFINEEFGYKVIRLFKGFNFTFHGTSYCNSAYPIESNINISTKGIALRDIKAGEEILEWYIKNINLANTK